MRDTYTIRVRHAQGAVILRTQEGPVVPVRYTQFQTLYNIDRCWPFEIKSRMMEKIIILVNQTFVNPQKNPAGKYIFIYWKQITNGCEYSVKEKRNRYLEESQRSHTVIYFRT